MTGGAAQGSILGVLDHNAVLEDIDSDFSEPAKKYVDDMTLGETSKKTSATVVDFNDETGKERLSFRARHTQKNLEILEEQCEIKGLKLNEKKSQLLSISAGRAETRSWIKTKDGSTIYSSPNCKILGFVFSQKPNY